MNRKWAELDSGGKPMKPQFLRHHVESTATEGCEGFSAEKNVVFRPIRGIRRKDSIVGDTKHLKD